MAQHKWDPICPEPRGLVRPVHLDPTGRTGPTRGQAKCSKWRQTSQGFYVPSDVSGEVPEQRIIEQSMRLPEGGAVTGWASLRLHRGGFFDGLEPDGRTRLPVPLAIGQRSKMRGDDEVRLSREPLDRSEVVVIQGIPCTEVRRAVFDEMRRTREVREATVAVDMAAAALLTSIRRVRAYLADHRRWRRSTMVDSALDLASEDSRSPKESRFRMIWEVDARLPRPLVNARIWDRDGNLLGIADLLDVEAGLVGEFDGADHRTARRHTHDIERQGRFERHGLEVLRVTGLDVLHRERVVDRIHFHRSRARRLPPERRSWTIVPPRGWEAEQTLDEYLEEQDFFRALRKEHEGHPSDLPEVPGW